MAQFDHRDENSSSVMSNLHHWFGGSHPVNNLISQIQSLKIGEQLSAEFSLEADSVQDSGGLDESSDSLKQEDDYSPPIDISSALRSMAFMGTLDLGKKQLPVSKLFSAPTLEENTSLSPSDDQDTEPPKVSRCRKKRASTFGGEISVLPRTTALMFYVRAGASRQEEDPAEEEVLTVSFQSKYLNFFPLYQDYCLQDVKEDLHRLNNSSVSELIIPQYLRGLQSRLEALWHSEVTPPQSNPPEGTPSTPPLPHPIRVTPSTLWQDLDEVKASGLLSSLTVREIRLQESMFELIGSEASYLRSLGVAVNHFYASKPLKQTLSQMEHHIMFSNIHHVMAASEKFLVDLEIRLGECVLMSQIGDIVLQHCPQFHSLYVPYVTNMMYQEALVNQLLQQNRDFLSSVKKLESDPVCQRQSLKSFLVLPFQRITRIKLILQSTLKLTEPDSDSILNLEKAIEAIHEIVTECDKGVRKMKQIEELVCLEMLLDFGKVKAVPLVVSGRFLVHQGPVKRLSVEAAYNSRVSFISVYLHLFNDLLIISSKKDQRFTVVDHAEFPTHVHLQHLKTDVLGLPPESFLLHLSQSQTGHPTAMIFVTHTRSDKEAWMKALSSKQ